MGTTPYPATPLDVSVLTTAEFGTGLHWEPPPSLDELCARFEDDVNRAVVWFIRDEALRAWRARDGISDWLEGGQCTAGDVCQVAAGFELNERWEFEAEAFCRAVDWAAHERVTREN